MEKQWMTEESLVLIIKIRVATINKKDFKSYIEIFRGK